MNTDKRGFKINRNDFYSDLIFPDPRKSDSIRVQSLSVWTLLRVAAKATPTKNGSCFAIRPVHIGGIAVENNNTFFGASFKPSAM